MVKAVDLDAFPPTRLKRIHFVVRLVKRIVKPTKQRSHPEFGLGVPKINGRIDEDWLAKIVKQIVSAPKIAVQKYWLTEVGSQNVGQPLAKSSSVLLEPFAW